MAITTTEPKLAQTERFRKIESTLEIRAGVQIYTFPFTKTKGIWFAYEGTNFLYIGEKVKPKIREKIIRKALKHFAKALEH